MFQKRRSHFNVFLSYSTEDEPSIIIRHHPRAKDGHMNKNLPPCKRELTACAALNAMMKLSLVAATIFSHFAIHVQSFVTPLHVRKVARIQNTDLSGTATSLQHSAQSRRSRKLSMVTAVIPADFKLPIAFGALGLGLTQLGNLGAGFPVTLVGLLLAFQATRVSFEFDDVAMEVKIGNDKGELESSGENAFVGGESRWKYDTWTNWEVFPSESLPVLMYFKETQTKPEGQIHFFPFIMDPTALLEEVRARVPLAK